MPLYTPGRRRAIVLLLLTSVLLITLDLRGNAVFDTARTTFNKVLEPIETAADVATRPVENAWSGITDYEDLQERYQQALDELDAQRGDVASGRAAVLENIELRALNDLPSLGDYESVTVNVVGNSPTNLDQIIEIDQGSNDDIEVGMAVINAAGLVGKVTSVEPERARVMLITDRNYTVDVKIVPATPPTTTTTTTSTTSTTNPDGEATAPATTTSTTTTSTSTTSTTSTTVAGPTTTLPATTTTVDVSIVRETGGFTGQGDGQFPQVTFLDDVPTLGQYRAGDLIYTSGSRDSLAPANIPVGTVVNVIDRSTAAGPQLEIAPLADLDRLNFVRVVLYKPGVEAPVEPGG